MGSRSIIFMTIILSAYNMANKSTIKKGIVFVNQGNFLLTTSHWTLIVDVTFEEYDLQLLRLKEHLQSLRQLIKEAQRKSDQNTALLRSLWNYTATEAKNLERILRDQDTEYRDLKSLVTVNINNRKKRALIDLGGDLLKFLFGTATSKEVEDLNARVSQLKNRQESIVHILEVQATVINDTLTAVKDNRQRIKMLIQGQEHLIKTMHMHSYSFFFGTALRYMEGAIAEFRSQITSLRTAIEVLEQGRLSAYFVPRRTLLAALADINNHLPADMSLIEPARPDNLFKYYQLITVTAVALPDTLRLFIDIPLMNPDQFFDLFEVISFPVHYPSINMFAYYRTDYTFIALSRNRQSYILLNTYEVLKCRTGVISICSPETAIWQSLYQNCEYALFMGFDAVVAQRCDRRLANTHPPVFRRLDQIGTWIYSTEKPLSLVVECPQLVNTITHPQVVKLTGTNILNLPNSCTGHLPGIKLTAHFQQRSTLSVTTKTHLIFPLVTDILNKSEIDLVQAYNNYTSGRSGTQQTTIDVTLKAAGDTLQNMKLEINKLKQSFAEEKGIPYNYLGEITSGTSGLLIIVIVVSLILFRKRLHQVCVRRRKATDYKSTKNNQTNAPSESTTPREALELVPLSPNVSSESTMPRETLEGTPHSLSHATCAINKDDNHERKLYPTIYVNEERPLRI